MRSNWNFTSKDNVYGSERGTPQTWQVTFTDGSVETFTAHQILWPQSSSWSFGGKDEDRLMFHGEIDGRWKLIYAVSGDQVREVRLLGDANVRDLPGEERLSV